MARAFSFMASATSSNGCVSLEQHQVDTVLQGSSLLSTPEVSPDGRWLAYQSNESGRPEIYARPYPNIGGGRGKISPRGGPRPVGSRNGRDFFFPDMKGRLSVVPIAIGGVSLVPATVQRLPKPVSYRAFTPRGFTLR